MDFMYCDGVLKLVFDKKLNSLLNSGTIQI